MKKYLFLMTFALLTLACVTLEGLVELSPRFIHVYGGLTIVCVAVVIGWVLKIQAGAFSKD